MCALLSPENLPAGAVKGLRVINKTCSVASTSPLRRLPVELTYPRLGMLEPSVFCPRNQQKKKVFDIFSQRLTSHLAVAVLEGLGENWSVLGVSLRKSAFSCSSYQCTPSQYFE